MRNHHTTHRATHRTRLLRGLSLGVVLTGVFASSVSAATIQVGATDNRTFVPGNVTTALGNTVRWAGTPAGSTEEHSVRQDAGLFDSGNPVAGLDFRRTFSAGTFPYHCEEHGDQGMRGQVRVAPQTTAAPAGLPFTVRWAGSGSNTGSRFAVQYRAGAGAWRTWQSNTSARSAVFGARNRPVRLVRGRTYSFRVRSGTSTVKSGLSPVKSFRVR
jgi:plastocyanin